MSPAFLPPPPSDLTGLLLLASPVLKDSIFEKTVILITGETEAGHEGFIINQATKQTLGEVIFKTKDTPLADYPVFLGGPVHTEAINFLVIKASMEHGFSFKANVSLEEAIFQSEEENSLVVPCLGYSGWAPKQLKNEFEHHTWFYRKPPFDITEKKLCSDDWKRLLAEISPYHELIANAPSHTHHN